MRGTSGSLSHGRVAHVGTCGAAPWKGRKIKVVELTRLFVGTRSCWGEPLFPRQAGSDGRRAGKAGPAVPAGAVGIRAVEATLSPRPGSSPPPRGCYLHLFPAQGSAGV